MLNAILRAKLTYMKNVSNEMNSFFAMQKTDFHDFELFNEKVILELNAQNHFFRVLRTPIHVFSATKQIMRMRGPQMLKNLFSQWSKSS